MTRAHTAALNASFERPLGPVVAHFLPFPAVGGTEIATLRVINAARAYGVRNLAFVRRDAAPVRRLFEENGIETVPYTPIEPSYRRPSRYLRNTRDLARSFQEREVALVHASDILGAFYAGPAARLAGARMISHVRNRYTDMTRRDRSLLAPVEKFVFVSRDTWQHFAFAVPPRRAAVLYDGIDVDNGGDDDARNDVRREFGIPTNAPVVGMVARVAPQKDYPTLVRAARAVVDRHPSATFVIVGDHSTADALREHHVLTTRLVADAGLNENFVFTDFRRDVPRFLRAFDIFVLSTHWEGLPLVLLEAMAYGTPVVATSVDGIPELIAHGSTGLLYPHEDPDGLATQMLRLLDDPAELRAMGNAGQHHVAEHFTHGVFARNVAGLYSELLGRTLSESVTAAGLPRAAV